MKIRKLQWFVWVFAISVEANPAWQLEHIHGPSQVGIVESIAVDLNQDGLMDVVSASLDDGHLRAYINRGGLNFQQQHLSNDVAGAFRVAATDINNDGKTDFLIPSVETHEIIALIADDQNQPFGYRKQIIADNQLLPTDARAADINGDGLTDVVSVSFESNTVALHTQNQQGQFTTTLLRESVLRPRRVLIQDFNNDGWSDILVASSEDNTIRLLSNNQGTGFDEITISDQLPGVREMAICDEDGAELPDFVASASEANSAILFDNLGNNSFSSKAIDEDLPGAGALHCADIDNDQDLELITISTTFGNIYTHEIVGSQSKKLLASSRDGYIRLDYAYFGENNSLPRVLTQSFFEHRNVLYDPLLSDEEDVVWEDFPDGAYDVQTADMDGDGDLDLVYAAFRQDRIYWAEQTASGYVIHILYDGVDGAQSIHLADLDQDGDVDAFSAGAWDDTFWFHQNQGQGQFTSHVISASANNAARITVADVNGDLQLDVVGTSSLDDSLRWYDRNGLVFTEHLIDDQLDGALALRVDDLNQDGWPDIAVGGFFANHITLFFNDGLAQFDRQQVSQDKLKPTTILSADVDSDSDKDIIFNASHAGTLWLLENSSSGYQEHLINSKEVNVDSMAVVDLNRDAQLEVVSVSGQDGAIDLSSQAIGETFNNAVLIAGRIGSRAIVALPETTGLPRFALASHVGNSIQIITQQDEIFATKFE